jgi:glycosyltransferase involved in cell wall biosynthesis
MATYNGERFIRAQLRSILDQLRADDEVVVVDDCSTDRTRELILGIRDPRISLHVNDRNRREVFSFGRAISMSQGSYIFLADQDDVWLPGRLSLMVEGMHDASLVCTNFRWIDERDNPVNVYSDGVRSADSGRYLKNLVDIFRGKTTSFGCAMAFRRDLVRQILPIPAYVESHDWWIAMAANLSRSNLHLDQVSLLKRRHGNNATSTISNRGLLAKVRSRVIFVRSIFDLWRRKSRRFPATEKFRTEDVTR